MNNVNKNTGEVADMTEFPPAEIWAEEEVPQISVTSDLSDEGKRADAFLAERPS